MQFQLSSHWVLNFGGKGSRFDFKTQLVLSHCFLGLRKSKERKPYSSYPEEDGSLLEIDTELSYTEA